MLYLLGLLFAAGAYGHLTDTAHGCLAFGLGLMAAALFDALGRHRRALLSLKFPREQAEE